MTADDYVKVIQAVVQLITAVGVVLSAWWAFRASMHSKENTALAKLNSEQLAGATKSVSEQVDGVSARLQDVHAQINGRMDELLIDASAKGRAEGKAQEVLDESDRQRDNIHLSQ